MKIERVYENQFNIDDILNSIIKEKIDMELNKYYYDNNHTTSSNKGDVL